MMVDNNQNQLNKMMENTAHAISKSFSAITEIMNHGYISSIEHPPEMMKDLVDIYYEALNGGNQLRKLKILYLILYDLYIFNVDQYNVANLIEDQKFMHSALLESCNVICDVECSETLQWHYDEELISCLLTDLFSYSIYHCRSQFKVRVESDESWLTFNFEYNGDAFPEEMCFTKSGEMNELDPDLTYENLSYKFIQQVLINHRNDQFHGYFWVDNEEADNITRFSISLPK